MVNKAGPWPFWIVALFVTVTSAGIAAAQDDRAEAVKAPEVAPAAAAKTVEPVAAEGRSAPDLATWIDSARGRIGEFPRRVVFLETLPAKAGVLPTFMPVDRAALEKLSYLQVASSADAEWDLKLNRSRYEKIDPLTAVMHMAKADLVVVGGDSDWQMLRVVKGQKQVVYTGSGPSAMTPLALADWLFAGLNWDGVVLDQKGDALLIGSLSRVLAQEQIQALAVVDSAGKFALEAEERNGAGLLALNGHRGGFGLFEIVFLGKNVAKIPLGTKVLMERKVKK